MHLLLRMANKKSSHSQGYKKIAITLMHKLIRTLFTLIKHDQLYDYNIATQNQKLESKSNNHF